jgi:hypothetical protein
MFIGIYPASTAVSARLMSLFPSCLKNLTVEYRGLRMLNSKLSYVLYAVERLSTPDPISF